MNDFLSQVFEKVEEWARGGLYTFVAKSYAYIVGNSSSVEQIEPILKIDYETFEGAIGRDTTAFNFAMTIYDILSPLAISFLVIWFLIELGKVSAFEREDMTLRSVLAPIIKFIAGYVIIAYGQTFVEMCLDVNNALISSFAHTQYGGGEVGANVMNEWQNTVKGITDSVNDLSYTGVIGAMFNGIIIELGTTIATGLITFHCYSRKIELLARMPFLGFGFADIYDGKNSVGVRNLKKSLSLALSGFAILVVVKIGTSLMVSVATTSEGLVNQPLSQSLAPVLLAFAMAGMVSTAKQITSDAFGV